VAHVLATQTIWQRSPKRCGSRWTAASGRGWAPRTRAAWIARLGADGARGHAIEYAGPAVEALSMEGRMTLCNLSIEGGARWAWSRRTAVSPFAYLKGRPLAPAGRLGPRGGGWSTCASDDGRRFDREVTLDAAEIAPIVTWGTAPRTRCRSPPTVPDPEGRARRGRPRGAPRSTTWA
jgi:3-isopropylmalate/(R)-2-methylmalate dehydratase large subunit